MTYCLLFILYVFYIVEMMLDKNKIRVILFKFKLTTHNINNASGPGTAKECTVCWWFRNFCKEDENLEDVEQGGWLLAVDNDQLRDIIEADSLTTTQEVAEELNVNRSTVIELEANWKGWKAR